MSEFEEIQSWLNSNPRDFDRGLMLYLAYVDDSDTRYLLERHRNAGKLFEILRERFYELKKAIKTDSKKGDQILSKKSTVSIDEGGNSAIKAHNTPDDMKERWGILKTELERWHTEIDLMQERVPFSESDRAQCAQLAKMVYDHAEELDALGLAMNHYKAHGTVPDGFVLEKKPVRKKKVKSLSKLNDVEKVLKLKNSINPGLSKLKSKIEAKKKLLPNLTGKDKDRALAKLKDWEDEQEALLIQKKEIEGGS